MAILCPECHHRPSMRDGDPAYCYCPCHDVADASQDLLAVAKKVAYYGAALVAREYQPGSPSVRELVDQAKAAVAKAEKK